MTEISKLFTALERDFRVKIPNSAKTAAENGKAPFAITFKLFGYDFRIKYEPPRAAGVIGAFMTVSIVNGCLIGIFSHAESILKRLEKYHPQYEEV